MLSRRSPAREEFHRYGLGGGPAEAVNRGFNNGVFPTPSGETFSSVGGRPAFDALQDPNASSLKYWILVPDTFTIPEPTTFLLMLPAMVASLAYCRRLRPHRVC